MLRIHDMFKLNICQITCCSCQLLQVQAFHVACQFYTRVYMALDWSTWTHQACIRQAYHCRSQEALVRRQRDSRRGGQVLYWRFLPRSMLIQWPGLLEGNLRIARDHTNCMRSASFYGLLMLSVFSQFLFKYIQSLSTEHPIAYHSGVIFPPSNYSCADVHVVDNCIRVFILWTLYWRFVVWYTVETSKQMDDMLQFSLINYFLSCHPSASMSCALVHVWK